MSTNNALQRLTKWRRVFAAWQLGRHALTGDNQQVSAQVHAVRDHREVTMLMRVELNALVAILSRKGVFTAQEFTDQIGEEAAHLDVVYEGKFPGFVAGSDGMTMQLPEAAQTISRWLP